MQKQSIIKKCRALLQAYEGGKLGQTRMPEDTSPDFSGKDKELQLAYFTLPMSLNYQRNSYKLWEAALKTFQDKETNKVFNVSEASALSAGELKNYLMKYKLALQPNKHIDTWHRIVKTVQENWGPLTDLLKSVDYDFLNLRDIIQKRHKKGFPYLSGPKIFNYWASILQRYCDVKLKNAEHIEIALDTHVLKCSVLLGVITQEEADNLSKEKIYERWREVLAGSSIKPADMHTPLWFWSRNGFLFKI